MKDLSYTSRLLFSVKGFTTYFLEGNIRILICLFYTAFLTEIHSNRDIPYLYLFLVILFRSWAIAMDSQPNRKRSSRWTEREDQYLCYLIQDCKLDNWSEIASQMEHNGFQKRPAHQYRIRWENCLDPTLIKEEWTEEENRTIINLQKKIGNKWAEIAKHLKGRYPLILNVILRSITAVKNHWYSTIRKCNRKLLNYVSDEVVRCASDWNCVRIRRFVNPRHCCYQDSVIVSRTVFF